MEKTGTLEEVPRNLGVKSDLGTVVTAPSQVVVKGLEGCQQSGEGAAKLCAAWSRSAAN